MTDVTTTELPSADLEAITARVLRAGEIDGLVVQKTEQSDWMLTHPAYDDWIVILRTEAAADFVVHARDDLLSLLAERDALTAKLARIRERATRAGNSNLFVSVRAQEWVLSAIGDDRP